MGTGHSCCILGVGLRDNEALFELDGESIQSGLGRLHFLFCQDHRYTVLVAVMLEQNNFVRITISRRRTVCKPLCDGCQPKKNKFG